VGRFISDHEVKAKVISIKHTDLNTLPTLVTQG